MFIEGIMQQGVHKLVSPKEFKVSLIRKGKMDYTSVFHPGSISLTKPEK